MHASLYTLTNPRACAGGLLYVCRGVSVSLCEQVFSRAVSAVGTEGGGMDKHHGRSVQQETGAALATERRLAIPRGVH